MVAILECAGFPLINIHRQHARGRVAADDAPLAAGRKTGATQAPQLGVFQRLDNLLVGCLVAVIDQVFQLPVTAGFQVGRVTDRLHRYGFFSGAPVNRLLHLVGRGGRYRLGVDHRDRCHFAAPYAGHPLDANTVSQAGLQFLDQGFGPGHIATDGVAHPDSQGGRRGFTLFDQVKMVIETGDFVYLAGRKFQCLRQRGQYPAIQITPVILYTVQILNQAITPRFPGIQILGDCRQVFGRCLPTPSAGFLLAIFSFQQPILLSVGGDSARCARF